MKFTIEKLRRNVLVAIQKGNDDAGSRRGTADGNTTTPEDSSSSDDDDATFHDAMQSLVTATRPQTDADVLAYCLKLLAAAKAADDDASRWKVLALSLVRRRYHAKAPEARRVVRAKKKKSKKDEKATDDASSVDTGGDGERLVFYLAVMCLGELGRGGDIARDGDANPPSAENAKRDRPSSTEREYASRASEALSRMAFLVGGTRDMCSLIELLLFDLLVREGLVPGLQGQREISRGDALRAAASSGMLSGPLSDGPLDELLSSAAATLDSDLALIRSPPSGIDDEGVPALPSTINTFLPHRERGNRKAKSARNAVQTIAELCIWSRTSVAMSSPAFVGALNTLKSECAKGGGEAKDDTLFKECVHRMQTCIRRLRQELNSAARSRGFSLCSSFLMDPTSITLSMVRRGKEGDVAELKRLAAKRSDARVLKLVARRQQDPSKAAPIESVVSLSRNWAHLPKEGEEVDEIRELELAIQTASVRATIERLRGKVEMKKEDGKTNVILASLDGTSVNDASAILVAAAMSPTFSLDDKPSDGMETDGASSSFSTVRLFIEAEEHNLKTLADVMEKIDAIFKNRPAPASVSAAGRSGGGIPASTKDVQNLIERHVNPGDRLLIFTSADLKLEQRVLEKLKANKSSIHVHIGDEWSVRMEREGAKLGDVTATLMWDDYADLDLHAICPDGFEISYQNKFWQKGELLQGNLDVDMNAGGCDSLEPVENIFFGDLEKDVEAPPGRYRIFVQNYAYHGNKIRHGNPVPWRVRITMNGESKEYEGACTGTGDSSNVTVCEFEYNGRKAPLPESVGTAVGSSNLVSVTSSVGTTLDSLCQLASVFDEHALLDRVGRLQRQEEEEGGYEDGNEVEDGGSGLIAARGSFHVTNRERLYLNLSRLPSCFREEVGRAFGGPSLAEIVAASVARRLVEENVPIQELKRAGYPEEIIECVKEQMQTFGL